jgi:ParB/RepB/Spo0J family partition protein
MHKHGYNYKELPVSLLERDPDQPRRDFGTNGEENRLLVSIKRYGIEEPIKVTEMEPDRYLIIDGHRRYICAQKLQMDRVPCRIYPALSAGEMETRRYEMQNNRRSWKPMERSDALERIKMANSFHTNREVAEYLGLTETMVNNSLQMRKQRMDYIEMMERYNLSNSYRIEFMRLKGKIRKIKDIEADEIYVILFEKVSHRVIRSAHDFRILSKLFLRASANEQYLHAFLTDPDMTVTEVEQRTLQTGFSMLAESLIEKITTKRQEGIAFTNQEKRYLSQLQELLGAI